MKLYHIILNEGHRLYVPPEEVNINGINFSTKSNNFYTKGGSLNQVLIEQLKPSDAPSWIDFKHCIGVDLEPKSSQYFCFPVFTDKIIVFDKEISSLMYDQLFYDENKDIVEEALNFDTGISWCELIEKYWRSMRTFDDFRNDKSYINPEVLVFEQIPNDIISIYRSI